MSSYNVLTEDRSRAITGLMFLVLFLGTVLAFFTGALTGLGSPVFLILLVLTLFGAVIITKPRFAVWVVVIGGTVFSGLTELYLPSFQQIRWAISLLSIVLILLSLLSWVTTYEQAAYNNALSTRAKTVVIAIIALIVSVFFTLLVNPTSLGNSIVGLKNYFQMFGVLAALAIFRYEPNSASKFINYIILLGLIQLPFALHQFIHFVPLRSGDLAAQNGTVAVDVVAGTFGGSAMGGGRSSTLALLSSIAITLVCAQWRNRSRTLLSTIIYTFIFLVPMMLNEAKLFVLLLPIGLFILFNDHIMKNPLKFIASGLVIFSILGTMIVGYSMLPGAKSQHSVTLEKYLDENISYNFGNKGYGNSKLNRTTVYTFWWNQTIGRGDFIKGLFGNGPGMTNSSSVIAKKTLANTKYRGYGIGLTAVSALLWEVGLLGTFAVSFLLFSAYRLGIQLQKQWKATIHWPFLRASQIAMLLFAISMLHNNYFLTDMSYQALLVLFIGYLLAMSRHSNSKIV
jgi:hypothetical protein